MSSNQVAVFVPVTVSLPFASVTRQRHQSCAPGGSDPLWRISHVHSALTVLPGMNCGKAFAITSPQVCCSFPYSNTTDVISTSLVIVAWKVADSGKLRIISLLVTLGSKEEKADVIDNRLKLTQSVSAMFNFRMKTLLSNIQVNLAQVSPLFHCISVTKPSQGCTSVSVSRGKYYLPIPFQSRVRRLTHVSFCMYNLFNLPCGGFC